MGHALLLAAKQAGNACLSLEWYVSRPIPGISQCEFTPRDSKVKQWQWFQAALRRRPDVVFIEHPGNEDTIGHVLAAARSSCLVIAAMGRRFEHLIDYLDSLGVPPDVSTTTLLGVIEQRLVPRVCPDCAECYTPKLQELRELRIRCERPNELVFCRCTGCNQCGRTGRAGVVGVHEIATMTEALQNMFLRKMPSERIRQQLFDGGMTTFYESAVHKLVHGQIASTTVAFFSRWLNQQNDWIRVDATTGECSRES
jgi:type II secretory ATPase GspE/PulE/Tfp pilus assembly ATPase PilB-like protein